MAPLLESVVLYPNDPRRLRYTAAAHRALVNVQPVNRPCTLCIMSYDQLVLFLIPRYRLLSQARNLTENHALPACLVLAEGAVRDDEERVATEILDPSILKKDQRATPRAAKRHYVTRMVALLSLAVLASGCAEAQMRQVFWFPQLWDYEARPTDGGYAAIKNRVYRTAIDKEAIYVKKQKSELSTGSSVGPYKRPASTITTGTPSPSSNLPSWIAAISAAGALLVSAVALWLTQRTRLGEKIDQLTKSIGHVQKDVAWLRGRLDQQDADAAAGHRSRIGRRR